MHPESLSARWGAAEASTGESILAAAGARADLRGPLCPGPKRVIRRPRTLRSPAKSSRDSGESAAEAARGPEGRGRPRGVGLGVSRKELTLWKPGECLGGGSGASGALGTRGRPRRGVRTPQTGGEPPSNALRAPAPHPHPSSRPHRPCPETPTDLQVGAHPAAPQHSPSSSRVPLFRRSAPAKPSAGTWSARAGLHWQQRAQRANTRGGGVCGTAGRPSAPPARTANGGEPGPPAAAPRPRSGEGGACAGVGKSWRRRRRRRRREPHLGKAGAAPLTSVCRGRLARGAVAGGLRHLLLPAKASFYQVSALGARGSAALGGVGASRVREELRLRRLPSVPPSLPAAPAVGWGRAFYRRLRDRLSPSPCRLGQRRKFSKASGTGAFH